MYGIYKGWIKVMATVRYFWHDFMHEDTFMCRQHSRPPYLSLLPSVWKESFTISASIFVIVPYWPPYSTDKFISCFVPGPSQWFFHFGEEIVTVWTHIGWIRWMFQNLPLPAAQVVRDSSSSVTLCIVMKNDGVLYHQVSPFLLSAGRRWCWRSG